MSSMINRLRTLWIGGDDMAGFKLLKTLTADDTDTKYTTTVDASITEVIVCVVNSDYNNCYYNAISFGSTISSSNGTSGYSSHMNGFHSILLGDSHVYTNFNYDRSEVYGGAFNSYKSRVVGIQTSYSLTGSYAVYIYGR